jgi:hypothetical protein
MNAIVKTDEIPISSATMEVVLATGDLSKLTADQRVEYYVNVCTSIGVNWKTRPFRFLSFQGQTVMYATRDLTDQLRSLRKISISITDKQLDNELFIVTARAVSPDGRIDEDVGAVTLGQLKGDARANAIMKAMTKAKRRVTMSICGLGYLDETEVETLSGGKTFDLDAINPKPDEAVVKRLVQPTPPSDLRTAINDEVPDRIMHAPAPPKKTVREITRDKLAACQTVEDVVAVADLSFVRRALEQAEPDVKQELSDMLAEAYARVQGPEIEEVPDDELADAETVP